MSKKSQNRRANAKRRAQAAAEFSRALGPPPEWLADLDTNIVDLSDQREAWEKAPNHIVINDECPTIDEEALAAMSLSSAEERDRDLRERLTRMKAMCRDVWDQRGSAHVIVKRWRDAGEDEVSMRTVQRYQQLSRQ